MVEDDRAIRRGLVDTLSFSGYEVTEREDGPSGLEAATSADLDLVLLDVILPGLDGFAILGELRRMRPTLPVIMVTARGGEPDKVQGLRGGADDYIVKPFGAQELLARVEAVLRRSAERPADVQALEANGLKVELERRQVLQPDGESRLLSELETKILRYLAANRGRAVARDELLRSVWGLDPRGLSTRTVDMHVARLREKLGEGGGEHRFVVTVRSKGYMLGDHVQACG